MTIGNSVRGALARLAEAPALGWAECFLGGLVLSSVNVRGVALPAGLGLLAGLRGKRRLAAAAGNAVGYALLWNQIGLRGFLWTAGGLALSFLSNHLGQWMSGACMVLAAAVEAALGASGMDAVLTIGAAGLAGGAARSPGGRYIAWGAGVLAVSCRSPCLGALAAGFAGAALSPGAALTVCLGAELGSGWSVLLPAAVLTMYIRGMLPKAPGTRGTAVVLGLAAGMLLLEDTRWELLALGSLGGICGAFVPQRVPKRGRLGTAQVQLEGTARALSQLQRQLLDWTPPPPDAVELARVVQQETCSVCPNRASCPQRGKLTAQALPGEPLPACRKAGTDAAVQRARSLLRRIRGIRQQQEEYRMALAQEYGFLADTLRELADRLPFRPPRGKPRRVQVSARSRGKSWADGDRVAAFAGPGQRFYVLLCDGMGTGPQAAAESREAARLLEGMLKGGMSPSAALGSVNSALALTSRAGAFTVDLAELHPENGNVRLYKWGAQPSLLLRRGRGVSVGSPGAPPGLGVTRGRETVSRLRLLPGDSLVLLSDGVNQARALAWAKAAGDMPPGQLAQQLLAARENYPDDATAVVIRMPNGAENGRQGADICQNIQQTS